MINKFNKKDLIKYRLEQVDKCVEEIPVHIENKLLNTGVNIYLLRDVLCFTCISFRK